MKREEDDDERVHLTGERRKRRVREGRGEPRIGAEDRNRTEPRELY